jgi:4-alpha-glucanotransferase
LRLFDRVRLDHFRGFVNYWAVPAEAATAKSGKWLSGPGHRLFGRFFEHFAKSAIIAEDLGEIDDEVRQFLLETGLPGMRVLQFGFDPAVSSTHLPCFYPANCVAFSGTHDNNTLLGWLWEAGQAERSFALNYAGLTDPTCDWGRGGRAAPAVCALLRVLWASAADLVISPLQDLLGYGRDARMNTPGEAAGQWGFRVTASELAGLDLEWLEEMNRTYRRHTDYLLPGKPV